MFFKALIEQWGVADLAADLGLPTKNVRSWVTSDSIPGEWFAAVAVAASERDYTEITVDYLSAIAERRRLARAEAAQSSAAA